MNESNRKKIIIAIIIVILIMIIIVYYILKNMPKEQPVQNTNTEKTENIQDKDVVEKNDEGIQNEKLKKTTDTYDYFISKYCLDAYYNFDEKYNSHLDFIDTQVIDELKLNENNFLKIENKGFCIDEIYKQSVNENENMYVVYFRLGIDTLKSENYVTWIRVNDEKNIFYIYPVEYLKANKLLNLKEDDEITIDCSKEIEKRKENIYTDKDIVINEKTCMQEIFFRYKYDLIIDRNHLYNSLDEKYKKAKFENFESLEKYIEENKTTLYIESLEKYDVSNGNGYKEYKGIGKSGKNYIFKAKNMMDYSLRFDEYSIVTDEFIETYNMSLPNVQAKYCVDRVIMAINNKDYKFVYDKLDPILKSNYYREIQDFENFAQTYFWEKNDYEFVNQYMLSDNIYQFIIKVSDKEGLPGYRLFSVAITLKDEEDFEIALEMN